MELFEKTLDSKKIFDGRVLHIVLDEVELPDGKRSKREVVNHPGGHHCIVGDAVSPT